MAHWDDGLLEELETLNEIARKAEEDGTALEESPQKDGHALCRAILWSMEQAVSFHRVLYDDAGKAADWICEKANPAFER